MPKAIDEKIIDLVEEPQLDIFYHSKSLVNNGTKKSKNTLNVVSLFSGCGGMDLGFEGLHFFRELGLDGFRILGLSRFRALGL